MQANCPVQAQMPPHRAGSPPMYSQHAPSDAAVVQLPPLNAGTFAAAVAVTSFLAMVTVLA